jgi:hypothetical protein
MGWQVDTGFRLKEQQEKIAEENAASGKEDRAYQQASMGTNAGEYTQKAGQAAQGIAGQLSQSAGRQATSAARGAGMSRAQAALAGAGSGADAYATGFGQGLNQYQFATGTAAQGAQNYSQMASQARERASNALYQGVAADQAQQQINNNLDAQNNPWNKVAAISGAAGGLLGGAAALGKAVK